MAQNAGINGITKDAGIGLPANFFYVDNVNVQQIAGICSWQVLGWNSKAAAYGGSGPVVGPCWVKSYTFPVSQIINWNVAGSIYSILENFMISAGQDFAGGTLG